MQGVSEKVEPASCHHLWIQLPQGSCTGIAGVGEQSFPAAVPIGVDLGKGGVRNERFATHLHPLRWMLDL